jgi:F-type H+-transporting ATPase subunit b
MTLVAATSPLTRIIPGLMIWTVVFFLLTFFILKRYAFGRIQSAIDERREKIRQSIDEADRARSEAHKLLEEHHALVAQARGDAESILAEARRVADSQRERLKEELDTERARRVEETRREIEAETRRSIEQIRSEVADLTFEATSKVTGKVLDSEDHRRLIEEAIGDLDFSVLERESV